ncbi:MAG: 23S rRNA (pseudouridine(1915)-N(3))-methyltransferase RlmH [Tissierellia bacterium]|nr:23S rRNA (pseudouridine(1915)-N(3))-methyltransferase RlmH [Tissierellia bacterium]
MNIDILAIGDIKEKYLKDAIKEYEKRIKAYANIKIIELAEERLASNPSESEINQSMEKEGERILEKIKPRSFIFALCIEGKQMTSEDFSKKIDQIGLDGYGDISFIIGGSNGLSKAVKNRADYKLSFSKMTFPHQVMRLILLEQTYRAYKISRNEPYHK